MVCGRQKPPRGKRLVSKSHKYIENSQQYLLMPLMASGREAVWSLRPARHFSQVANARPSSQIDATWPAPGSKKEGHSQVKTYDEMTQADIPEDALISIPTSSPVRLRGSNSTFEDLQARPLPRKPRQDDEEPHPDDDPPPPPPPPPPLISTPDLAVQFPFCLNTLAGVDEVALVQTLHQAFGSDSEVRTACINENTQPIGIWLSQAVIDRDKQARERGLRALNIGRPGEIFSFFINASTIRRKAQESWDKMPKRLNGDGNPDKNGSVHLTGFSVSFESPDRVIARVTGFDERPWPDVSFTVTSTDTLSADGVLLHCDSDIDIEVDSSWISFLTGFFSLVFLPLGLFFLAELIIIASLDDPDPQAGVGASAASLLPREILITGGLKIIFSYTRIQVASTGIFAGGTLNVIPRAPEVRITGPTLIAVQEGTQAVAKSYSLMTEDLRPALRFEWGGDGTPNPRRAKKTQINFLLSGAKAGDIVTRRITVRVTDADGLTGLAERTVRIHVTPKEEDDEDFPNICRHKPWLSVCQEPMERAAVSRRRQRP